MRWFILLPYLLGGEILMFLFRGIAFNSNYLVGSFAFLTSDEIAIPFGILLCAYFVLYVLSVVLLMGFHKKAVAITLSALAVDVAINALLAWYMISSSIAAEEGGTVFSILYLLGSIAVLVAGIFYFKKRAKLFI